ncbi:MAG: hypothetical protein RLZZ214_1106 [Verrucomicrobiota bacterium]|jgi:hypothetical protein
MGGDLECLRCCASKIPAVVFLSLYLLKPKMNPQSLPANIEAQLSELEIRHRKHQAMLEDHHEARHRRRERHRRRHDPKAIAITLI